MKCPQCEHRNPNEAKYCNACAFELKISKDNNTHGFLRCTPYTPKHLAEIILASKNTLEGERKLVTVMFADVADYTAMSDNLDPENIHKIMDGCFKILMDEIHAYYGTINQFTGDGVMALFGAPLALEDHAQNGCRAALAIQKALKEYSKELEIKFGLPLMMRIGLNSGPVIVGSIGDNLRMDYTAIGDTTNLAARMENMAKPGTVVVSQNLYHAIQHQFECKPLGKATIKGKNKPIEIYQLIKDKAQRPRLGLERQIYSEMVGRDSELNKLELQVNKAIYGEGSIVNIIGEAGIGKSRLIAELKNHEALKRVMLFEGRAISIGRNLSFHLIIDLFRNWAQIKEEDNGTTAFGNLESAIRNICPKEADEILPFIATLMGMKLYGRFAERIKGIEGEALEKLILKNMKDLLTKAAQKTPLVIIFEDLHWADTSSIELLESLFRLAETQRILFINVFRPSYMETGDRIVQTIKEKLSVYFVEIHLNPLTQQMSETLINNMLNIKVLHHVIKDKIIQRAGGNPFFIEEVVRSFIDEGAVIIKGGNFEVTDKLETMVIPHTINDVLMARIDRLDEETRNLIKVASVIGRSFFHRILAEVANTIDNIEIRLSYLKEIQLIRERKRLEELEYLFKHALAQETAYESILHQKRKEIHLRIAKSIETVFNNRLQEFYGMLAFHFSKGEDEEKAEEYLIKAGEEAMKSSASSEAVNYFQRALDLYLNKFGDAADPQKIAMLESNIALAFFNKGKYFEAIAHFDKALEHYHEKLPQNTISIAIKFLACFFHFLISMYLPFLKFKKTPGLKDLEVVNLSYKKLNALAIINPKRFVLESFYFVKHLSGFDLTKVENGFGLFVGFVGTLSYPGLSFRLSKKVLDVIKGMADTNNFKFRIHYKMIATLYGLMAGDWNITEDFEDNLVTLSLNIDEIFNTSVYIIYQGVINIDKGCFHNAQKMVDKLNEIADVYENEFSRLHKYELNTKLLMKRRNLHDLLSETKEGIDFGNKTGMKIYVFICLILKARAQILLKDIKGAEESLLLAEEYHAVATPIPYYNSNLLLCLLILNLQKLEEALQANDLSEIKRIQKKTIKIGRKAVRNSRKAASDRTEALRLMGTTCWLINKPQKALNWWKKSIMEGERLEARLELSRTYMEVGRRLLELKGKDKTLNNISAQEYLAKARIMFKEMGLQYDLDEFDKISAKEYQKHLL